MVNVDLDNENILMHLHRAWRDGPYGIFICLEDEGELLDFYVTGRSDRGVLGPPDCTAEQRQFAIEAARRPSVYEPVFSLIDGRVVETGRVD